MNIISNIYDKQPQVIASTSFINITSNSNNKIVLSNSLISATSRMSSDQKVTIVAGSNNPSVKLYQ